MENMDSSVYELLEYLQDMVENSAKMPITGKTIIDKKEFNEVIEQIMNCLPDQFKKAQWIVSEKDRILADAQKEYDSVKKETIEIMKQNVESHDIVREAKLYRNCRNWSWRRYLHQPRELYIEPLPTDQKLRSAWLSERT